MLYVTTRDHKNAHTPRHPLRQDRAGDSGLYVPFQSIRFSQEDICALKEKSFGQCVAEIMNLFFSTKLTGWEVDFALGRKPFRLVVMSHKILVGELFNNPGNAFTWAARKLRDLVVPATELPEELSQWTIIATRIAFVCGLFGELQRLELAGYNKPIDISVAVDDFSGPMALYYAKEMGLPVGRIVFGCNENSGAWDLLHHGELHTGRAIIPTPTEFCDHTAPASLERLVHSRLGREEAIRYGETVSRKGVYAVTEEERTPLSEGFFGAVISRKRMQAVIRNVSASNAYQLHPYGALAYGALQDYRAIDNEVGPALILSEYSAETYAESSKTAKE